MPEIMIFKSGKYPQGDWPKERIQRMIDAYDPVNSIEAAVVIGHRNYNSSRVPMDTDEAQFAHGWVQSIRMDGAGKVWANIPEFSAESKNAMAENKLRYVSVEIFEFDTCDEKQPPYLRAVALLGRDTPQIPTTRLPSLFGMMTGGTVVDLDKDKQLVAYFRKVTKEDFSAFREAETKKDKEETQVGDEDVKKLKADLEVAKARAATFEAENAAIKTEGVKKDAEAFFSKLRDEGKLTPAIYEKAVSIDQKLSPEHRVEFRAVLSDLVPQVDLSGNHFAGKKDNRNNTDNLAAQVKAYQAEHKIATFGEAANALYLVKPELFDGGKS